MSKTCKEKRRYPTYKAALGAALRMYTKFKVVETPYFCRECDGFHLTAKCANENELKEVLWYKKGKVLKV